MSWEHKEPRGSELDTDSIVNCTVGIYCVWRQAAVQEFKFQWKVKSKIKHCVSSLFFTPIPSLPNSSIEWLRVTVQCDMGCAAAVMAWSSPDRGFAKAHMTTEAPAIPW